MIKTHVRDIDKELRSYALFKRPKRHYNVLFLSLLSSSTTETAHALFLLCLQPKISHQCKLTEYIQKSFVITYTTYLSCGQE